MSKRRINTAVSAGSMADIAFLLLIFFLVTTTIEVDRGITVKLPRWESTPPPPIDIATRNVFSIHINGKDELLVRGQKLPIDQLKEKCIEFISNPGNNVMMAENPTKALIKLQNDINTSYTAYIGVYDQIKSAYQFLWSELTLKKYGFEYSDNLSSKIKLEIRAQIPFVVSESEATDYYNSEE